MYNSNDPQFVFKQDSGKIWNFYYDEKLGLCYCNLTKRNSWSEAVPLQKNINRHFAIEIDSEDNFHIVYQDKQGNIFYSFFNSSNSIKTIPVLNSKSVSSYDKYFSIIPLKDIVHLFYVLSHNNSVMLVHQSINNGKVENPRVIDYVCSNSRPYSLSVDKSGNIYAFYQASDGKYQQIGYKKYISSQKFWGEFIPVTKSASNNELPWTIIDGKNTVHICYQRCQDRQYEIVYQQKVPNRNMWTNDIVLHSSSYPFTNASIAYINEKIIVFWVRDDVIYYSSSSDYGNSWSKPSRYNLTAGRQLVCIRYKTNSSFEADKVISSYLPGSFLNGLKLAFYSGPAENEIANLTAEELKNMIIDGLKLLRSSVEELSESESATKETISKIIASQQALERELVKYSVKLNLMESELKQLKQHYNKLEEYKNVIETLKNRKDLPSPESEINLKDVIPDNIGVNPFEKYITSQRGTGPEVSSHKSSNENNTQIDVEDG